MKKLISLLLALMMVLSLATVAFAAEPGAIIITGAALNDSNELIATYNLYKMMDVSYEGTNYSYRVDSDWVDFFKLPAVQAYFSVDSAGVVIWNEISGENTLARASEVASLAIDWAKANISTPDKSTDTPDHTLTITADHTATVTFGNLDLGYYLVDSSVGALCGLTTTNPSVTIATKNVPPTIDKKVQEDALAESGTSSWGSANTAGIGETVNFDSTIEIETGAQNLVYHDKMDDGLTFVPTSVVVKFYDSSANNTSTVDAIDANYTISPTCTDGCSFEITFSTSFAKTLAAGDKVIILYSATVNKNAVIANAGNKNEAWLDYGDDHETTHDTTVTKLYAFDLLKIDSERKLLTGAEFQLYNTKKEPTDPGTGVTTVTLEDIFKFIREEAADGKITYRIATEDEKTTPAATDTIIVTDGQVRVSGLDNGTYFLKETKEPTGYHKIDTPITITIADSNNDVKLDESGKPIIGTGVQVINQSGTILPQTGATGTTMFIFFGMFVMLSTGVLLVTKKRMSMIEE